jgi:diguanylate cyclase (GGDEF)-like protein
MLGQSILRLVPEDLQEEEAEILTKRRQGMKIEHIKTMRLRKDGSRVDVSLTISPIKDSHGRVIGSSKIARDISIERRREDQLAHFSQHDQLTGLPNRQLMHDRLKMMLARAERNNSQYAVMVLDLDRFKEVNDRYGHHIGDELLAEVANRLQSTLRKVDTVSRVGGDEFIILISELHGPNDALLVAEKLRKKLSAPYRLSNDITANISASIGIGMNIDGSHDGALLLRMADSAMYYAKSSGRQIELYSPELAGHELRRREVTVALHAALQAEAFHLEYQPIVDVRTGAVLGFEALLRLHDGRLGNISPAEFIPIAEDSDLIRLIGAWVIRKASQAISSLNRELESNFFISVNLSPRQIQDDTLLSVIETALKDNQLKRGQLEIEITEGVLMKDNPNILLFLHSLRTLGVLIDIDDFGTGFSNISYLLHFPIDRLKLDQSIVGTLTSHPESSVVAKAIVALAHQLHISVIAEGIETQEQAEVIRSISCDLAQGYFFARPAPMDAHRALLSRHGCSSQKVTSDV